MNIALKSIVGAVCLIIIAAGAVYLWQASQRSDIEANYAGAREELFRYAEAKPHEDAKVRDFCARMAHVRYGNDDNSEVVRVLVGNCRVLGYR